MDTNKKAPRLLGAAFLIVVFTSLSAGLMHNSAVGSGNISEILVNISNNLTLYRISILVDMVTSLGVVVLAGLLFVVLNKQNRIMAIIAFGWWLAEAMSLALSKAGSLALIPLSLDFVKAGAPELSFYQTLGEFLHFGMVVGQGQTFHMFFYCAGGILWYTLFYKSKYIPRPLSLFGLAAVVLASLGIVFEFFGYDVPIYAYLPILPFELTIGTWLMLRGIKDDSDMFGENL
jgi:hypothetical protein